ncbi:hypothetical protein H7J77_04085 [Mycolicibacillus parakoreensis]|uniref:Glyoxalase n=1 Tax=Mycolicibacillus parakoreensis TaxID=1069221 RepID=A0ABY3U582_9MYCO|nr:hypothetical protein [Mycolicibacillus parakoreensis]MCV7314718.1 hypothetical protein [Mycolicibacillus parakoreensis]ULN53730.1 hypothetical protein MIU77_05320 [Mycolicibacillus parakoreensis]
MNIDGCVAAVAGAETLEEVGERLTAAGFQATVQDEELIVDDGAATVRADGGTNQIGHEFFLWCIYGDDGELSRCVARGPHGSCPPIR